MRTTLDIDEDVLLAAKEMAGRKGIPTGKVVSELLRQALVSKDTATFHNGIPIFPYRPNGGVITMELVNRLRDETP